MMQAYEFDSTVYNGVIHIPEQYRDKMPYNVKVIVLAHEEQPKAGDKKFTAIQLRTKGFRFNREESNER